MATREVRQRDAFVDARIRIRPPVHSTAYAIEEKVPWGLTANDVSQGGLYHAHLNAIRWGPFLDNEPRDLTYQLIAEGGRVHVVSFDGHDTPIEGDHVIATQPGDADRDGDVDLADALQMVECIRASADFIESDCDIFDFDGDGEVDLADFVAFQAAYTVAR